MRLAENLDSVHLRHQVKKVLYSKKDRVISCDKWFWGNGQLGAERVMGSGVARCCALDSKSSVERGAAQILTQANCHAF